MRTGFASWDGILHPRTGQNGHTGYTPWTTSWNTRTSWIAPAGEEGYSDGASTGAKTARRKIGKNTSALGLRLLFGLFYGRSLLGGDRYDDRIYDLIIWNMVFVPTFFFSLPLPFPLSIFIIPSLRVLLPLWF